MSAGDSDYVQESEAEKQMAELAGEQWDDYKERFVPLENEFMGTMDEIRNERPLATGRAANTVTQAYDSAYDTVSMNNTSRGADPSSGSSMMGLAEVGTREADDKAGAVVKADQSTENRYYAGQQQVVNMGRGVATEANLGMRTMAGLDAAEARSNAQASATETSARVGAFGTVTGAAGRAGLEKGWFGNDKAEDA